jgi:hypothetical protein
MLVIPQFLSFRRVRVRKEGEETKSLRSGDLKEEERSSRSRLGEAERFRV